MHRKVFDENMHTSFTSYHSIMKIVFKNQNICTYIVCENVLDLMKNVKYFYNNLEKTFNNLTFHASSVR